MATFSSAGRTDPPGFLRADSMGQRFVSEAEETARPVSPFGIKAAVDEQKLFKSTASSSLSPVLVAIAIDPNSANNEKPSLSSLGFLKNLNAEKKKTKDGHVPKRRGPKPDSKPALTRRQELNRQAQRTHRERKEVYIKTLEQEVLRLKEVFAQTTRERGVVAEENRRLKQLLSNHGISYDFSSSPIKFHRDNTSYGPSSSGSISGSYRGASEGGDFSPSPAGMATQTSLPPLDNTTNPNRNMAQLPTNRLDYDQIGINFVLTLERPCMEHAQYLMVRSHNPDGQPFHHPMENPDDAQHEHMSGHALMASGPLYSHLMLKPTEAYPQQMPVGLDASSLVKLFNLSAQLPLDREGEITPIMAWSMIFGHERIAELNAHDLDRIGRNLSAKIRCYGFGAVLEEFEVRDALDGIFMEKDGVPTLGHAFAAQQISV